MPEIVKWEWAFLCLNRAYLCLYVFTGVFFSKDSLPQALGQSTSLSAGATIEPADVPANPKAEPGVGVVERGGSDEGSSTCGA